MPLTQGLSDRVMLLNDTITLRVVAAPAAGTAAAAVQYTWFHDDAAIAGAAGDTHTVLADTYAKGGKYAVVVNDGATLHVTTARLTVVPPAGGIVLSVDVEPDPLGTAAAVWLAIFVGAVALALTAFVIAAALTVSVGSRRFAALSAALLVGTGIFLLAGAVYGAVRTQLKPPNVNVSAAMQTGADPAAVTRNLAAVVRNGRSVPGLWPMCATAVTLLGGALLPVWWLVK